MNGDGERLQDTDEADGASVKANEAAVDPQHGADRLSSATKSPLAQELNELVVDLGAEYVRTDEKEGCLVFAARDLAINAEQMQSLAKTIAQIVSVSETPALKTVRNTITSVRIERS